MQLKKERTSQTSRFESTAAISDFLLHLRTERGLAANTLEAYGRDLHAFHEFLGIHAISSVTSAEIIRYVAFMKEQGYAEASCYRALIAIKVFFRFLVREEVITHDPAALLETPKLWQEVPHVLTQEEVEKLLQAPNITTELGIRNRAILELLYASGMRVSELCGLTLYDVDDLQVKVFGKGSKERLVPIGKHALQAVDSYLHQVRAQFDSEQEKHLFVTTKGKPINRSHVFELVRRYAKAAGISKSVSPHTLRHSFATHLMFNGADLRVIQELLGHAHISSTDRYTHLSTSHLQEAFKAFHPSYKRDER